jgi:ABC-type multidrug transport system fused ATPase/permease subunit
LKRPLKVLARRPRSWSGMVLPASLYRLIWTSTSGLQIRLCAITGFVIPLSAVPLELQRRIVNEALEGHRQGSLAVLASLYLLVLLAQGWLKYLLNISRGRVLEEVNRLLRHVIHTAGLGHRHAGTRHPESGTLVSMVVAEVEDVAGFAAEGVSVPLQQVGTAFVVLGYLLWVEPLIAALALLAYLPQLLVVPPVQRAINAYARTLAKLLRLLGEHVVREQEAADPCPTAAARFDRLADLAYGLRMRIYRRKYLLTMFGNLCDAVGPLVILVAGGMLVLAGRTEVSTLVVFISGFQRVVDPLGELVSYYRSASVALVKYRLIRDRVGLPEPAMEAVEASPRRLSEQRVGGDREKDLGDHAVEGASSVIPRQGG